MRWERYRSDVVLGIMVPEAQATRLKRPVWALPKVHTDA